MAKILGKDKTVWISGRRKTAVARIKMAPGFGQFIINGEHRMEEYFPATLDQSRLLQPFKVTGRDHKGYDISVKVVGGGKKSQLGAVVLGLAKAIELTDANLRPLLKDAGLLTRDPRMKERKKYGLKRARKAPQFSKR
ncbi:30S ribosomal protein S9 [candidate division WWE3 bacterium]|nr:30S ribosomal protein S9 [candidate division WWE3 bacterium]